MKTLWISTSWPGIRMLARRIRALGFSVDAFPFPTNTFESIHPNIRCYIVVITDNLLVIILPAAVARYANSFSTSNSSSDSLHVVPTS
jgi:hypothetical protein